MSIAEFVDLCSDEETETVDVKTDIVTNSVKEKVISSITSDHLESQDYAVRHTFQNNNMSNEIPTGSSSSNSLSGSVPVCRQFWKAGDFESGLAPIPTSRNGQNRLRVHPKFLHSNATSHKWVFGAIAELLDNAVDEVQKGATFVIVDKIANPRNGDHALLIRDDGCGMDPESLHCCMSFGFSNKQSDSSIGQYGNGLKTSTMRLGADAIIFSRCMKERTLTQSVGLLSYTFLRYTGADDIVVPLVDYEFDSSVKEFRRFLRCGSKQFSSNLSALLSWSPFSSEDELLKQFDDIGLHGTKVIVFNLWLNDDGQMELDFEKNAEDIMVSGEPKLEETHNSLKIMNQMHIANRLWYSLRAYISILYLHLPQNFTIYLRGEVVQPHNIVKDLRHLECIKYRPQDGSGAEVITLIGFLEGAPNLSVHGFNIYHKNRLILPFRSVMNYKGRGVAGVLEANFIHPTHDKQDFEKSPLYQKLETRLKDMTLEYWDYHCHLIGYLSPKGLSLEPATSANPATTANLAHQMPNARGSNGIRKDRVKRPHSDGTISVSGTSQNIVGNPSYQSTGPQVVTALSAPVNALPGMYSVNCNTTQPALPEKRISENHIARRLISKRSHLAGGATSGSNQTRQHGFAGEEKLSEDAINIIEQNKKLITECSEYEKAEKELTLKAQKLQSELLEAEQLYNRLMFELKLMDEVKLMDEDKMRL